MRFSRRSVTAAGVAAIAGVGPAWAQTSDDMTIGSANAPVRFEAKARPERLATKEQLLKALKDGKLQIVDARSEKEFCGLEPLTNKRAGAIPGAKHPP